MPFHLAFIHPSRQYRFEAHTVMEMWKVLSIPDPQSLKPEGL
jgi:hypothetical protein